MTITALHRALGIDDPGFTFDLMQAAVEGRVAEQTQLDWKSHGPLFEGTKPREDVELELTKDLAAMANSGGGVIAYGVVEAGDHAEADSLNDVGDLDSRLEKRLLQVGWNMIFPPLSVHWHRVTNDDESTHLIIAEVPASPMAPHMVRRKGDADMFGVPWRDGPHTRWMDEPAIASAYATRFDRGRHNLQTLSDRSRAFAKQCSTGPLDVWVTAVAVPTVTPTIPEVPVDHDTANLLITRAWGNTSRARSGPRELLSGIPPRRGMRRMTFTNNRPHRGPNGEPDQWTRRARAEIHRDGTVTVAYSGGSTDHYGNPATNNRPKLLSTDVEETVTSLLGLMWATHAAADTPYDYLVRVSIHLNNRPVLIQAPDSSMSQYRRDVEEASFLEDLDATIAMDTTHEEFLTSGTALITDAVNQLSLTTHTLTDSNLGNHTA